ncbi:conserved protein of unknown function [Pseudodesulfovibrio profundus]|uniref:Uncharacterized protein n=1 Tax=Pseudodesulfovibrio profundus TaxID=57320 RepID=A0A2C8F9I2_9BACT|nr:hypothetical protein [Pseudodesulfovibrio profundus]MBC17701.1 hypothetical protein [Desulfovibrio sp.]SOB59104.1 conserved protein of unknown function [Pseudodesulfovibrio profundus]|tara:strand:- start:1629 stop:1841 length:213 start_codon:yes stop_codon:yes gene_type:complete
MTAMEREDLQDLLVRIDERVKTIQDDIREINMARRCISHHVKIKTLERMVWGCLAGVTGVGARIVYEALR